MFKKILTVLIVGSALILWIFSAFREEQTPTPNVETTTSMPTQIKDIGSEVFVPAITSAQFDNLKLSDLPSTLPEGYADSAVNYKDHFFVASINHILEYDQDGQLVRYSNPETFICGDLPSVITLADDTLYAACWNYGIYEIDLVKNRAVYLYDFNNGLMNVQNLQPVIDGNNLWVGTFNGLYRIDRDAQKVIAYNNIFGSDCLQDNVRVFATDGDIWVASQSGCGAAEYRVADDGWTFFGPNAFNKNKLSRVDFNDFVVSNSGIFATHQDGGPGLVVLSKFDPITNSWKRIIEKPLEKFSPIMFLPSPDEYSNVFSSTINNVKTWHFKKGNDLISIIFPNRQYLTMSSLISDRYFLLSSMGLEQLVKGQTFPELLAAQTAFNANATILVSEDENFVLGKTDSVSDYSGEWFQSVVTIYDRQTKHGFSSIIPGVIGEVPPLTGFEKDPSFFKLLMKNDNLVVVEGDKTILDINVEKEEIVLSE